MLWVAADPPFNPKALGFYKLGMTLKTLFLLQIAPLRLTNVFKSIINLLLIIMSRFMR